MIRKSQIRNRKLSYIRYFPVLLICLITGVSSVYLPEYTLILSFLISVTIIFLIVDKIFDFLFCACLLVFLFAQFRIPAVEFSRWLLLLILGMFSAYLVRNKRFATSPVALGIGLLASYSIITSGLSYYPTISFLKSISLFLLAGFLLFIPPAIDILFSQISPKDFIIRMYFFLAILIVISNTFFFVLAPSSSFLAGRFRGWFMNPNGIGAIYGIFLLPIVWFKFSEQKNGVQKFGILLLFILTLVQLLASQSRAGILAGILSLYILFVGQKNLSMRILILGLIVIILLSIYLENPESNLIKQFIYRNETILDGGNRIPKWIDIWNRFLVKPILGSGLGVTDTGQRDMFAFSSLNYTLEKANSYLGVLEELGIIGLLIIFLSILIPIFKACWKGLIAINLPQEKSSLILIAIIVAGLFNAIFEAWLFSVGSLISLSFWIFAALLLQPKYCEKKFG